jgi:hypothetical protein
MYNGQPFFVPIIEKSPITASGPVTMVCVRIMHIHITCDRHEAVWPTRNTSRPSDRVSRVFTGGVSRSHNGEIHDQRGVEWAVQRSDDH